MNKRNTCLLKITSNCAWKTLVISKNVIIKNVHNFKKDHFVVITVHLGQRDKVNLKIEYLKKQL